MNEAKTYKTAGAFRTALEARLQARARAEGTDLQRLRRQVAFDRFLARMFSKGPKAAYPWVLKGGYAMELRMHAARTTKDIDLTLHDGSHLSTDPKQRQEQIRGMLQEAAAARLDDYFEFLVGEATEDLQGAPQGGSRYPVQARMDGRDFARFHVDVGVGDEVLEPLDVVTGQDWLGFGGVAQYTESHLVVLVGNARAFLGNHRREDDFEQTLLTDLTHHTISSNCLTAALVISTWLNFIRLHGSA